MIGLGFDLARLALLQLEPETAHELALRAIEMGLYPRASAADDQRLAVEAFGLRFPNPVGIAAGFDKDARVPRQLIDAGFGFAEVGTVTPRPQIGNPRPRMIRLASHKALINRLGFNNEGHAAALARLKRFAGRGIVGVNIGANKESEDKEADYVAGLEAFAPVASYLTVNISSPNTPGLRDLQAPAALAHLLTRLMRRRDELALNGGKRPPILVKLSPDIADDDLPAIVRTLLQHEVDGIIVANTTLARDGLGDDALVRETGGLSGRPLFARSTRALAKVFVLSEGRIPLIGVGGIDSGERAVDMIEAGASLLQLYTGFVFEGPALLDDIKRALLAHVERLGVDSIAGAVGRRAEEWAKRV